MPWTFKIAPPGDLTCISVSKGDGQVGADPEWEQTLSCKVIISLMISAYASSKGKSTVFFNKQEWTIYRPEGLR